MLRRAGILAYATALATVACAGVAGADPTTTAPTPPPPPPSNIDITAATVNGSDVDISVTYSCEPQSKAVTLQVFVRGTAEGAEQTVGAKTKATCDDQRQTATLTATKIPESEPFTPAAGQQVRVIGTLVAGDNEQSLEGGTAIKRLIVK
ncbi:hypothetical protein ACFYV7_17385 [Nocardia suismassiliense]|uniref:Lipoprotein n=1 Tax=Nocardia suismassiliense TaxID=2077092 RepID=A0ABW6QTK8_9NOCA